jgi:hypothetical protein
MTRAARCPEPGCPWRLAPGTSCPDPDHGQDPADPDPYAGLRALVANAEANTRAEQAAQDAAQEAGCRRLDQEQQRRHAAEITGWREHSQRIRALLEADPELRARVRAETSRRAHLEARLQGRRASGRDLLRLPGSGVPDTATRQR